MSVKRSWIERGDTIEVALPRNLTCAACKGGGCDRCERSGAITLRKRGEEAAPLKVPLPQRAKEDIVKDPSVVLRIPEQGGHADRDTDLPRGLLLLQIVAADHADAGVAKVRGGIARLSRAPASPPASDVLEPESRKQRRTPVLGLVCLMLAVAWVAVILLLSARLPH